MNDQQNFMSLYEQLDKFKDDVLFHELGFGIAGPYNSWLLSVLELHNQNSHKIIGDLRFIDLRTLGMEYMRHRTESEFVKFFLNEMKKI